MHTFNITHNKSCTSNILYPLVYKCDTMYDNYMNLYCLSVMLNINHACYYVWKYLYILKYNNMYHIVNFIMDIIMEYYYSTHTSIIIYIICLLHIIYYVY